MTRFAADSSMTVYNRRQSWPRRQPSCSTPTGQRSGEEPSWPGGGPQSSVVALYSRRLGSVDLECHCLGCPSIV